MSARSVIFDFSLPVSVRTVGWSNDNCSFEDEQIERGQCLLVRSQIPVVGSPSASRPFWRLSAKLAIFMLNPGCPSVCRCQFLLDHIYSEGTANNTNVATDAHT